MDLYQPVYAAALEAQNAVRIAHGDPFLCLPIEVVSQLPGLAMYQTGTPRRYDILPALRLVSKRPSPFHLQ